LQPAADPGNRRGDERGRRHDVRRGLRFCGDRLQQDGCVRPAGVNAALDALRVKAEAFAAGAGLPSNIEFIAEARYEGQAWDIDVPLRLERFRDAADVADFRADFDRAHEQLFTIRDEAPASS
jgi:hypothetical protein